MHSTQSSQDRVYWTHLEYNVQVVGSHSVDSEKAVYWITHKDQPILTNDGNLDTYSQLKYAMMAAFCLVSKLSRK